MLTVEEIRRLINKDAESRKKRYAKTGLDYYEGRHDILKYRIFFFDANGKLQEDLTKSNIKICHPFFKLLVDQQAQYMLSGKNGYVKSDDPGLQRELDAYFNDNESFTAELYELLIGCIATGSAYMYAYRDEDDRTAFQCADSMGLVEVEGRFAGDGEEHIIYRYVDKPDQDDKLITRIQVWDKKQTWYYCQTEDGPITADETVTPNPRPHILYRKDGDEEALYAEDYGMLPFFRLDNGKKQQSGLQPVKALIDDYDLMNAGLSNNIQDTNEALYVVSGFQGDNLDELMLNIRNKKHIGVEDGGGVEIKTINIPTEARKVKMEVDEKNIFRFGMGVNTEALKDTSATVSVAIKSAYANLDLKCEGLLPNLKKFMRQLLRLVLQEINERQGSDYAQKDVYFTFEREIITNAQENAQIALAEAQKRQTEITTILNLSGSIDETTKLQLICEQLELDYEEIRERMPEEEPSVATVKKALDGIQPEGDEA